MRFDPLIFRRIFATLLLLGAVVVVLTMAHPLRGQTTNSSVVTSLQYNLGLLSVLPEPVLDPVLDPPGNFHAVKPQEFDPGKTYLVQAAWLHGTGCPTMATIALPNMDFTGISGFGTFTDAACPTGDPNDQRNAGLLLVKTGPTVTNFASATADRTGSTHDDTPTRRHADIQGLRTQSMPSADRSARRRAPAAMVLALGAGLLAAPAVPAQAADTPQPAAHYTFDQDDLASGRITDSSGNGLTATLVNGSTAQSVAGSDGGKALSLPGGAPTSDGAYVRLPREVLGDASDLTVSARVKWSGDKSAWQRIFDLGTDTTSLNFLQSCASDPSDFFRADTGADLSDAFEQIAQSLNSLRLSH